MLIEADKRGPGWAVPLTYAEALSETFYVPSNCFVVGTMNTGGSVAGHGLTTPCDGGSYSTRFTPPSSRLPLGHF